MSSIGPKPTASRLNPTSYENLRQQILRRDGWRCQVCGAMSNLEVHHKQFRSHSGHDSRTSGSDPAGGDPGRADAFRRSTSLRALSREEVGIVTECGDGIARVEGLPSAMANELLEFENGVRGLALNLDVREIGVVILGEFNEIEEGQQVRRTGEILSVPVGDSFLGRVVGPLGEPLDGKGPIEDTELRPLETQAPSVVQRQPVKEPLQTGIKAIDAMTAIGRGQRQLIIGDRQTGKSAIAIDAIINQKAKNLANSPNLHGDRHQPTLMWCRLGGGRRLRQIKNASDADGVLEGGCLQSRYDIKLFAILAHAKSLRQFGRVA